MEKILNRKVRILLLCLVGMLMAVKGVAQAITVKGSVKDKTGEAIIGANVLVIGTTNGTITDFNGNFALDAKKGDILSIKGVKQGLRCYLAVAGGFDVPLFMCSASTYLKIIVGGFE